MIRREPGVKENDKKRTRGKCKKKRGCNMINID